MTYVDLVLERLRALVERTPLGADARRAPDERPVQHAHHPRQRRRDGDVRVRGPFVMEGSADDRDLIRV
ncbi:hypothetical protein [Lentzea sp. NPDC055074]